MREKDEIAFKDFKSSITIGEFEALLSLARRDYREVSEVIRQKEEFVSSCEEKMNDNGDLPEKIVEQIKLGFKRRAEHDMIVSLPGHFERHRSIVDFLNRFEISDENLKYLY